MPGLVKQELKRTLWMSGLCDPRQQVATTPGGLVCVYPQDLEILNDIQVLFLQKGRLEMDEYEEEVSLHNQLFLDGGGDMVD